MDGAASPAGKEVADFHHETELWDAVVRRDRDVSWGLQGLRFLPDAVESEGDIPRPADPGDEEGGSFDELELLLAPSRVGATGAEACVDVFGGDAASGELFLETGAVRVEQACDLGFFDRVEVAGSGRCCPPLKSLTNGSCCW